MSKFTHAILGLAAISLVTGCGGGGGGTSLMETGESPTIQSTIEGLAASADSLLISDGVGTFTESPAPGADPSGPQAFRAASTCRTTTSCSLSVFGVSVPLSLAMLQSPSQQSPSPSVSFTQLGSRQGVPMAEWRDQTTEEGVTTSALGLGGWLDQHFFAAVMSQVAGESADIEFAISYSVGYVGEARGTNPMGNATYVGGMAGFDVSATANTGNRIQGDATLTFDLANTDMAVSLTNIQDLDAGGFHQNMTWSNVPVADGRFGAGSTGDSLQGQFYGQNHEEVGGVFERNQIIGAFGASRQ